MRRFLAVFALIALVTFSARADVKLPAIISDNMCLQANKAVTVWGKADAGEKVTVKFANQQQTATTDADGKWAVVLRAMPAAGEAAEMTVSGKNTITVKNILVGEVWIASGQSNMEFSFSGAHNNKEETPKADYPKIRIFNLRKKIAFE